MAKWFIAAKKADFEAIGKRFRIDPVIARIIRNRDILEEDEVERFLKGTPDQLYDPFLLLDMDRAVDIIREQIKAKQKIRIIGDYDVDGICSTYILKKGLESLGAQVDTAIPHRVRDGYGLNENLITEAAEAGVGMIITCDNGIAAAAQIRYAKTLGMKVIVTDHHEVPYEETQDGRTFILPEAEAVIDPKRQECSYPYKGICGAVVAYKVVEALLGTEKTKKEMPGEFLELAAFATIGDVMELRDENRIIVKYGLAKMKQSENQGIRALLKVNGIEDAKIGPYHVGYILGPCLNATGRLDTAARALELLDAAEEKQAVLIAGELKNLNDSRKDMTAKGVEAACALAENECCQADRVLVLYLENCHESLAGIIAGRIREKYGKPAFVLTNSEEGVKGSGRSIEAYSMYEEMSRCKELFLKYGGHKMAAGLTLKSIPGQEQEAVECFRRQLNQECRLTEQDFEEKVHIDVPMPMRYVGETLLEQMELLEPFGVGNPRPLFAQKHLRFLSGRIFGRNQNVGKYTVEDESGNRFETVYFGDLKRFRDQLEVWFGAEAADRLYAAGGAEIVLHVVYYPSVNEFRGRKSIQYVMQYYDRGM